MRDPGPVGPVGPTAPWAPSPARERLSAVEGDLAAAAPDPAALLDRAVRAAADHARLVEDDALLLYAGGNVPLPGAPDVPALLSGQPSMGYPGAKYQAGLEHLDVVEVAVSRLVADVMGAAFAEVRPTSATLANLAVYTALCSPGDTIAVLPDWAGGHLSHHGVGAAGVRGLRVVDLPYDDDALDVDLGALPAFLAAERPRLVVVGASLMLRPHRLRPIADAVHAVDAVLLYDASHVSGLIAERRFQAPLSDGADLVTFSTYKSFGGPAGGAIVADDPDLMSRVTTAVYPGLVANYDLARLLPLGAAARFHAEQDGAYADACIATAQHLAEALVAEGCAVVGGGTASHHVAVDVRDHGGGTATALRLADGGILLSEIGCVPGHDPSGAVRIGTQTVVRQGLGAAVAPRVATLVADGVLGRRPAAQVRADVAALRRETRPAA